MSTSTYLPKPNLFEHLSMRVGIGLFIFFMLFGPVLVQAATPQAVTAAPADGIALSLADPESKAAVRELVSQLSDDSVRALLIERLDAVAEEKELAALQAQNRQSVLGKSIEDYLAQVLVAIENIPLIPESLGQVATSVQNAAEPEQFSDLILLALLAAAMGLVAERAVAFLLRKRKQRLIDEVAYTLGRILRVIYTRLAFDIAGVMAFGWVSYRCIVYFYPNGSIPFIVPLIFTSALATAGYAFVLARFLFAPTRPDLRICLTSDQRAWQLTISYTLLALYVDYGHNLFYLLVTIGFNDYGGRDFIDSFSFFHHISIYAAAIFTIWYNRSALTEVLLNNKKRVTLAIGDELPEELSWFAVHWPTIAGMLLACLYLLVEIVVNSAGVGVYSQTAVYMTFGVIFLWPGIDANISLLVGRGVRTPEDETEAAAKARRKMQQGLMRVGRVVVVGFVVFVFAKLWGLNIMRLAESNLGAQFAGGMVELLFVLLLAYLTWELVTIFIERWLASEGGSAEDQDEGGGEIGGVGLSRVATVLPIMHKTAKVLIVLVTIVLILDKWGINIGPIIAGAGVLGLAIGFGAQTLVKDIVSGLFFLADDAFRVGEYIDVGGTMGNVEKISLRSLRLRHHRGLVHTIPYGEIPKLTNFSRDWVIMKLRFRVPFDTDINKVKKIFKTIGNDLLQHPELGEDFLQPFKSQGVAEVDDNGIVVRGKFMAKPGKQFMIRKEVYVRVQKAFDEAGIPFARKQVMVHIPGLEGNQQLSTDDAKNIAAAASEAADDEISPVDKK